VSELLTECGHEVVVANPRRMESISKNRRKHDRGDARALARLVRADPELLYPIRHRGPQARRDLMWLRARHALVEARTGLINCGRGLVKSMGARVSSGNFGRSIPESLAPSAVAGKCSCPSN
jgi:transposase